MSNDHIEDLEATNADEVAGGQGPGVEVNALGQTVEVGAEENRHGGRTITAGDAEVETRETRDGRRVTVDYGDDEIARVNLGGN